MFKRYAIVGDLELVTPKNNYSNFQFKVAKEDIKKVAPQGTDAVATFDYDPDNWVYFRCRAITADKSNANGDMFESAEVIKAYKTFVGVGLYKDHDSDSVDKSVGKVLWAEWIPEGKYVECYCAVDRKLAPDLARRVETGAACSVSMGASVGLAICSLCGNQATNQATLCTHMTPGIGQKGQRNPDGSIIYETNKMIQFTELSLVTVPADPTAKIFEVFASAMAGKISENDLRKILREEISVLVRQAQTEGKVNTETATPGQAAESTTAPSDAIEASKKVAKIDNSTEEQMKLNISYLRGQNLRSSFFVAQEGDIEFKVAAADVIPVLVQQAIETKQAGVATPKQVIADLAVKCHTMADFKKWAKKRKKKNSKAVEKFAPKEEIVKEEIAPDAVKKEAGPATELGITTTDQPAVSANPVLDNASPAVSPVGENPNDNPSDTGTEVTTEDIHNAIRQLHEVLERQQNSKAPRKVATVTTKDITDHHEAGEKAGGKYAPAADQKATQEITSKAEPKDSRDAGSETGDHKYSPETKPQSPTGMTAEEPKGHIDQGQTSKGDMFGYAPAKVKGSEAKNMQKTASGEAPTFSVNQKELEAPAKPTKPAQAAPGVISWDSKEMSSEQVKTQKGGNAGSQVKKFFNRLPAGGLGEAPKALDLKSGTDPEKELLRKALEEEKTKRMALQDKQNLQAVADKIYEIVKALREKNILTAGKEEEVIGILGSTFKDLAHLDSVLGLVTRLAANSETLETVATPAEAEAGQTVPQTFETVEKTEDAIETMARIWNR